MGDLLHDFSQDLSARSLSFYANQSNVFVHEGLIEELSKLAEQNGQKNARLCLHQNSDDPFHEMIIVEYQDKFYPPHRHPTKVEAIRSYEGEQLIVLFDDTGLVIEEIVLDEGATFGARIGVGQWHTVLPLSPRVIYFETKTGPFCRERDNEAAPWLGKIVSDEDKLAYMHDLRLRFLEG